MIELTAVGWLTWLARIVAVLMGSQVQLVGFTASCDLIGQECYFSDVWYTQNGLMPLGTAMTLGTTIMQRSLEPKSANYIIRQHQEQIQYEFEHVDDWLSLGLAYPIYIGTDPCRYDPQARFAKRCPNERQLDPPKPPKTGVFRFAW